MSLNNINRTLAGLVGALTLLVATPAPAEWRLNFKPSVTPVGQQIYDLHMIVLWIVTLIGIGVFGVMIYSIVKHRKVKGAVAAQFHENTFVEVVWTTIPFLILVGIAIPATSTLVAMEDTSESAMNIKVTGYQWRWQYEYLDDDISFYSALKTPREAVHDQAEKGENYLLEVDNEVVVPVGKKIRFLLTANDVLHAWWVPELGVKKDTIPGFINEIHATIEEPGIYRGQCAELCGRDHGFMPIVVRAVTQDEYDQWVAEMKGEQVAQAAEEAHAAAGELSLDDLMAKGEAVYGSTCQACHQASGQGIPGSFPALAGSTVATGDPAGHIDTVVNGRPGTAMAAFGKQLTNLQLAAVVTYTRNAWGNGTGDAIQVSDIQAAR